MQQSITDYVVYTRREKDPGELNWEPMKDAWPEFIYHDPVADMYIDGDYYELWPDYIFYVCDGLDVIGHGKIIPVHWSGALEDLPDRGWDWALENGVKIGKKGQAPNMVSALEITIAPAFRGQGVSQICLKLMRQITRDQGLHKLIAPVRPSQKYLYPLIPMEEYITWRREDGFAFDAWLRTHERMGAKIVKVALESMIIEGNIAEWQEWSGMTFPGSGEHIVPLALHPVAMDIEQDKGVYIEANVWMVHELGE